MFPRPAGENPAAQASYKPLLTWCAFSNVLRSHGGRSSTQVLVPREMDRLRPNQCEVPQVIKAFHSGAKPLCSEVFGGAVSLIISVFCQSMQKHLAYSCCQMSKATPNTSHFSDPVQYLTSSHTFTLTSYYTQQVSGTHPNKPTSDTRVDSFTLISSMPLTTQNSAKKFPRNAFVISTSCSSPYKTRASKPYINHAPRIHRNRFNITHTRPLSFPSSLPTHTLSALALLYLVKQT